MAKDESDSEPGDYIHIPPAEIAYLRDVSSASRNVADVNNTMRQKPINMRSREDMMFHMMSAHDVHPLSLQFYDESEHDSVPLLRDRSRDWSKETVPELDHKDVVNWHDHEHTAGEYAKDYPHTNLDDEHFHH